jgi:putative acetyltransferase
MISTSTSKFMVVEDDPRRPEVVALLAEHFADMTAHSPPESIHALDVDGLRAPEVTFWSVWLGTELVGCGALKELDTAHGEIKSMHTASTHLRRGVARQLLEHILCVSQERGYRRVSLETGSMEAFAPARALYSRFGFGVCGPFARYVEDPHSTFMTRELR